MSKAKVTGDVVFEKPRPERAREHCDHCGGNTTVAVKKRNFGVCPKCLPWRRLSFRETLWCIPEAAEADAQEVLLTEPTHDRAASRMKKLWPLEFPARDWDAALIIMVDERRRRREEATRRI